MVEAVFVAPSLAGGGAERNLVWLAERWAHEVGRATLVTVAGAAEDAYELDPTVRRVALGLARDSGGTLRALGDGFGRLRALRREIRRAAPEVVISFTTPTNVLTLLACTGLGARVIVSERNHPPRLALAPFWFRARAPVYARAARVVAQTERSADWLRERTRSRDVVVIPNPCHRTLGRGRHDAAAALPSPTDRPFVLAVGAASAQKGFDVLLRAFARSGLAARGWRLVIVGGGSWERYEELAAELSIERCVRFPGRAPDPTPWYEAAELFVLSSRWEGFPNVLVEAMSNGLAVVATDCETGPAEIVTDGRDGVLVPVEDVEALAGAIVRVGADRALRERLGGRARDVARRYAPEAVFAAWREAAGVGTGAGGEP